MAEEKHHLACQVLKYRSAAYSENTKLAYRCQAKTYFTFCDKFGCRPVPATSEQLCKYAAYLASTMKPCSVRQYINVVKLLHVENGFKNPLEGDWFLSTVLKGIDRTNGVQAHRKLPITLDILRSVSTLLDFAQSLDCTFWAACLIAFFGMLRKASLFSNEADNHMRVGNCIMYSWGLVINSTFSKTIQCQEREVFVALPYNGKDKVLCPVYALLGAMKRAKCLSVSDHLFMYESGGKKSVMTYALFTKVLKSALKRVGLPVSQYSGHSFRRGGATHALQCGIPAEVIKAQGDWKTLCYLDYVDCSNHCQRAQHITHMYV